MVLLSIKSGERKMVLQHTINPISLEVLTMQNIKWYSSNIKSGQHKMASHHTIIHISPKSLTY
jgi:hypothetical protein